MYSVHAHILNSEIELIKQASIYVIYIINMIDLGFFFSKNHYSKFLVAKIA